jgi:broad specificity phosphatase PhoE
LSIDPGWDEFDLDHVYRELAPVLCEEDAEFRREFEATETSTDPAVHRHWTANDVKVFKAWVAGHPRFRGETWLGFRERIAARRDGLREQNVVVFTSGTPIGIWAALSLDVEDHRALRLTAVIRNASYTTMALNGDQLRLHTFNAYPHLHDSELHTLR